MLKKLLLLNILDDFELCDILFNIYINALSYILYNKIKDNKNYKNKIALLNSLRHYMSLDLNNCWET